MLPRPSSHDVVDVFSVEAVFLSELHRSVFPRNIFGTNLSDEFIGEFCFRPRFTFAGSSSAHHVSDIVLLCSFQQMTRINTQGDVTSVTSTWLRPAPEFQKKGCAMRENMAASIATSSVGSIASRNHRLERPQDAIVSRYGDRSFYPMPFVVSHEGDYTMEYSENTRLYAQDHPPHPSEPVPPPPPTPDPEPEEDDQGDQTK